MEMEKKITCILLIAAFFVGPGWNFFQTPNRANAQNYQRMEDKAKVDQEIEEFSRAMRQGKPDTAFAVIETYSEETRGRIVEEFKTKAEGQKPVFVGKIRERDNGGYIDYSQNIEVGEKREEIQVNIRVAGDGVGYMVDDVNIVKNPEPLDPVDQAIEDIKYFDE